MTQQRSHVQNRGSAERQEKFLAAFAESGGSIDAGCEAAGVKRHTYERWRQRFPQFKGRVEEIRLRVRGGSTKRFDGSFGEFRRSYFGMSSPWFHVEMIDAYENTPPGNITLILLPPEHGKTTLFEDYASFKLAVEPSYRFTVGSESQTMSRKILARVKARMTVNGPFPRYIQDYGPFAPEGRATSQVAQPWGQDYFSIFRKGDFDERDYSMVALGIGSQIAGTRTDHLHVDDVQSLKSEGLTEKILETFRQDWLSRPGERGRTSIAGTRVAEDDFYQAVIEAMPPDILRVIRYPAIILNQQTKKMEPLWPYDEDTGFGYTMEMLERQHAKVGDDAWSRNYMQQPRAKGSSTFSADTFDKGLNPGRQLGGPVPGHANVVISLDPALGGKNCLAAWGFEPNRLVLYDLVEREKLVAWEQIFSDLEQMLARITQDGARVTDVIIETMAFQKGLETDERLMDLQRRYGFGVRGHLTGSNKYDENIGVPSMVTTFNKGQMDLPWSEDDRTRHEIEEMRRQFLAWRPKVRGNKLRQDRLMVTWFAWILWRERGGIVGADASAFNSKGLPWKPTPRGLLLPSGAFR